MTCFERCSINESPNSFDQLYSLINSLSLLWHPVVKKNRITNVAALLVYAFHVTGTNLGSNIGAFVGMLIAYTFVGVAAGANVSSTVGAFFGVVLIGVNMSLTASVNVGLKKVLL